MKSPPSSICFLALIFAAGCSKARSDGSGDGRAGFAVTVQVERFTDSDSLALPWMPAAFSDSLAGRLALVHQFDVRPASASDGGRATFTVGGTIGHAGDRLVIKARVMRSSASSPIWSATLWRGTDSLSSIARDVAAAVAEAIASDLARHSVTDDRRK